MTSSNRAMTRSKPSLELHGKLPLRTVCNVSSRQLYYFVMRRMYVSIPASRKRTEQAWDIHASHMSWVEALRERMCSGRKTAAQPLQRLRLPRTQEQESTCYLELRWGLFQELDSLDSFRGLGRSVFGIINPEVRAPTPPNFCFSGEAQRRIASRIPFGM